MYLVHHHTEINAARLASFTHSGLEIENYKYVCIYSYKSRCYCKMQNSVSYLNFTKISFIQARKLSIIWDIGPLWFKSQFFILLAAAVVVHRQAFFSDNAAMSASSHRIIMASASVERRRRPLLLMKIIRVKCATPDEEQAVAFVLMLVNHNGGHQKGQNALLAWSNEHIYIGTITSEEWLHKVEAW